MLNVFKGFTASQDRSFTKPRHFSWCTTSLHLRASLLSATGQTVFRYAAYTASVHVCTVDMSDVVTVLQVFITGFGILTWKMFALTICYCPLSLCCPVRFNFIYKNNQFVRKQTKGYNSIVLNVCAITSVS